MLDIHALRIFLEAARTENFTEAGRNLNLTQPAVSAQIKTLEDYLQVKLFERDGRTVRLTKSGETLMPMAQQLIHMAISAEETIRASEGKVVGNLVIGCSAAAAKYVLPHLVMRFQRLYPNVHVSIPVVSRQFLMEKIAQAEYDLGVVSVREPDYDMSYSDFFLDRLVLIAPSSHPWARQGTIKPHQMLEEYFICREPESGCRATVAEGLAKVGLSIDQLHHVMEIGNAEALAMAVEHGIGMSFVSQPVAVSRLPLGRLAIIQVEGLELISPVEFVYSRSRPASPAQIKFLEFANHAQNRLLVQMLAEGRVI